MSFTITPVLIIVLFILNSLYKESKSAVAIETRRKAFHDASRIAKDIADFELYDTEGKCGQRLERARIAHQIELELLSKANSSA